MPAFGSGALEEHLIVAPENFEQCRVVYTDEPRGFTHIPARVNHGRLTAQRAESILPQEKS